MNQAIKDEYHVKDTQRVKLIDSDGKHVANVWLPEEPPTPEVIYLKGLMYKRGIDISEYHVCTALYVYQGFTSTLFNDKEIKQVIVINELMTGDK